ncbi:MAG: tetraacyldisaccharide 4'-kinase [Nitrospiria bacterium]
MIRIPFSLLATLYALVIRLRIKLYEKDLLRKKKVLCRVVSVGNLTVGGTGKTPFTIYLAEEWKKRGMRIGIVSRGYGRKNRAPVILVTDGKTFFEEHSSVGDEPALMAQRLKGVPIVVSGDRFKGCQWLLEKFKVDLILLDDAFQHLRIHRDLNILLVDATRPFADGHLLPRGSLREPLSETRRADLVILTRADQPVKMEITMKKTMEFLRKSGIPQLQSRFQATGFVDLKTDDIVSLSHLENQRVFPFCGIGNPDAFLKQLLQLGLRFDDAMFFQDHYAFQVSDFLKIETRGREAGAAWWVTTEKDAVKIKSLINKGLTISNIKIVALRIDVAFFESDFETERLLFKG